MSAKHAPGPWRTHTMSDGSRNVIAGTQFVCQFSHDSLAEGELRNVAEANGRLIAAAPDLLNALAAVLEQVDGYVPNTSKVVWGRARAAIAAATGEQQP